MTVPTNNKFVLISLIIGAALTILFMLLMIFIGMDPAPVIYRFEVTNKSSDSLFVSVEYDQKSSKITILPDSTQMICELFDSNGGEFDPFTRLQKVSIYKSSLLSPVEFRFHKNWVIDHEWRRHTFKDKLFRLSVSNDDF